MHLEYVTRGRGKQSRYDSQTFTVENGKDLSLIRAMPAIHQCRIFSCLAANKSGQQAKDCGHKKRAPQGSVMLVILAESAEQQGIIINGFTACFFKHRQ